MFDVTPTINALKAERRTHEVEIDRINGAIHSLESYKKDSPRNGRDKLVFRYSDAAALTKPKAKVEKPKRRYTRARVNSKSPNAGVFPTAHRVVAEAPKAVNAAELLDALKAKGYNITMKYASVILSQMTKRGTLSRETPGRYVALIAPRDVSQSIAT